jgi:hypothetical protein
MLAEQTNGFSGRNISDICKRKNGGYIDAERRWASKLIRKEVTEKLPELTEYLASLHERKKSKLD